MSCYFCSNKSVIWSLLSIAFSFSFFNPFSFGIDNMPGINKDEKIQELHSEMDSALLKKDYSQARQIYAKTSAYESHLSFDEKLSLFWTNIFLYVQEDKYDIAVLNYDSFFRANIDEIEKKGKKDVTDFVTFGLWFYFVKQNHREIGAQLAEYLLTYYEKWMNEWSENYKFKADESLSDEYGKLELVFLFYNTQRDILGMKRVFSAMQRMTSFIDIGSYIVNDPEPLFIALTCCHCSSYCIKNKRNLRLKSIKADDELKDRPFVANGSVVIPFEVHGSIEIHESDSEYTPLFEIGFRFEFCR